MTAEQLKNNNEIAALDAYVNQTISEEIRVTYYRTAYEHGAEAFARGEQLSNCGDHYWVGVVYGTLGVRGWKSGWQDAYRATLTDLWHDDASYATYQSMA